MEHHFSIEDRGQPNPRQAEVDRTRDAAARSMREKAARPGRVTMDDVSMRVPPAHTATATLRLPTAVRSDQSTVKSL